MTFILHGGCFSSRATLKLLWLFFLELRFSSGAWVSSASAPKEIDSLFNWHVNMFYQPSISSGLDAFLPFSVRQSGALKALQSSVSSQLDKDMDEPTATLFQRYDAAWHNVNIWQAACRTEWAGDKVKHYHDKEVTKMTQTWQKSAQMTVIDTVMTDQRSSQLMSCGNEILPWCGSFIWIWIKKPKKQKSTQVWTRLQTERSNAATSMGAAAGQGFVYVCCVWECAETWKPTPMCPNGSPNILQRRQVVRPRPRMPLVGGFVLFMTRLVRVSGSSGLLTIRAASALRHRHWQDLTCDPSFLGIFSLPLSRLSDRSRCTSAAETCPTCEVPWGHVLVWMGKLNTLFIDNQLHVMVKSVNW